MAQVRRSTGRNWVRSQPRVKRTTQGKDSQEDTNQQTHGLMGGGGAKINPWSVRRTFLSISQ